MAIDLYMSQLKISPGTSFCGETTSPGSPSPGGGLELGKAAAPDQGRQTVPSPAELFEGLLHGAMMWKRLWGGECTLAVIGTGGPVKRTGGARGGRLGGGAQLAAEEPERVQELRPHWRASRGGAVGGGPRRGARRPHGGGRAGPPPQAQDLHHALSVTRPGEHAHFRALSGTFGRAPG
eukprot:1184141-Prorocentrum_minimum.AAC.1